MISIIFGSGYDAKDLSPVKNVAIELLNLLLICIIKLDLSVLEEKFITRYKYVRNFEILY